MTTIEPTLPVGRCLYCQELVSQKGMTRHLSSHFKKLEKEDPDALSLSYHLVVSNGDYFLHLLMQEETTFKTLDSFLREIWLECCGHMSCFTIKSSKEEISEEEEAGEVFENEEKLIYEYDFGSTTLLDIQRKGTYAIPAHEGLELITRNEPLFIPCSICKKKPAIEICAVHIYDEGYFCEKCGLAHAKDCPDFLDYAKMPLVNSPRTGECGYTGGSIDTERDGMYVEK